MKKTRIVLAAIGGVFAVALLAMLFLVWSAYSDKVTAIEGDEETNGLESVRDEAAKLSRKPIYPCKQSVNAIESNRAAVVAWSHDALKLVSAGDRVYEKTTPAAFKTFIVADAKRLAALPGAAKGVLVKPDFAFGPFKEYIVMGNMPAEDKLAEMQRRWDDVATVVEMLAKCGIAELTEIQFADAEAAQKEPENTGNRKKAKNNNKAKRGESEPMMKKPAAFTYGFTFYARPSVIIQVINALETSERFMVTEDFSLLRDKDVIADTLGGGDAKSGETRQTSRRRRRGRDVEAEKSEEESKPKTGIITDPAIAAPVKVQMTVSVYDFRSLEGAEAKEGELKKEVTK